VDLPPDMKSPTSMLSSVPAKISAWMFMLPPRGSSEAVRAGKWLSCVCRPGASLHEQQSQQKRVEIASRVSSGIKGRTKKEKECVGTHLGNEVLLHHSSEGESDPVDVTLQGHLHLSLGGLPLLTISDSDGWEAVMM
jgi:hypothetical protein